MAERDTTELEERLAEAQAQIESLQAATADAEARAATAKAEAGTLREQVTNAESDLEAANTRLRESAALYRTARLSASPEVPPELVPEAETIEDVERGFEAAKRVVDQIRERLKEGVGAERRGASVPAGSPLRRQPDTSSLPASEKIRIGLRQLSEREGR